MDLIAIVTIALLVIVIVAIAGGLNGQASYIAWGLFAAASVLIIYMALRR